MIPAQFDYVRPGSLDEALRILADREGYRFTEGMKTAETPVPEGTDPDTTGQDGEHPAE